MKHAKLTLDIQINLGQPTLTYLGATIMSAISDFALAQNKHNDKMDQAISELQDDIKNLNDQIAQLQDQGKIAKSDQDALDKLQERAQSIADKLDALNALTPPKAPIELPGGDNGDNNEPNPEQPAQPGAEDKGNGGEGNNGNGGNGPRLV